MAFSALEVSQAIAAQFDDEEFGGCHGFSDSDDLPVHKAAKEGNVIDLELCVNIMNPKKEINRRNHLGCTPLRLAAAGGYSECVSLLLSNGAYVDKPDVKGQTPLHVAVKNKHYKCAKLLLESGANPNGDAHNRSTPLSIAVMQGSLDLVQLLLDFHAEIVMHRKGCSGLHFTVDPFQMATAYKHYDCLKLLLAYGGKPFNISSFTGVFSLYHTLVAQRCSRQFAELLYQFGITPWVKDNRGLFPWDTEPRGDGKDDRCYQDLMQFFQTIKVEPRSLKSWCRLAVWKQLLSLKKNASVVKCLSHIPLNMMQYLSFEKL